MPVIESATYVPAGQHSFHQKGCRHRSSTKRRRVRPQSHLPLQSRVDECRIGAGTGLFTRALLADHDGETEIASLKAIEPSAGMRDVFKQRVNHESVTISHGTFDNVPSVENGWADLIIIAQVCQPTSFAPSHHLLIP